MPGTKQTEQLSLATLPQPAMENLSSWLDSRSLIRLRMTNRFFNSPSAENHLNPSLMKLLEGCSIQFCAGYALMIFDGRLYAWGEDTAGLLGIGLQGFSQPLLTKPTRVDLPKDQRIIQTVLEYDYWLALSETGRVFVSGKQADGTYIPGGSPVNAFFPNDIHIVRLYSSYGAHYALTDKGQVYVWGNNARGQLALGNDSPEVIREPQLLSGLLHRHVAHIELTPGTTYFLTRSGTVYFSGQQHHGEHLFQKSPTKLKALRPHKVKEIIINTKDSTVFAITRDGKVFAWCQNSPVLQNDNSPPPLFHQGKSSTTPALVALPNEAKVIQLTVNGDTAIALTSQGELYSWGDMPTFLGPKHKNYSASPILLPLLFKVKSLFVTENYYVMSTTTGKTYAIGAMEPEQLKLPGKTHFVSVQTVGNVHLALTNTGNVYVWSPHRFSQAQPATAFESMPIVHLSTAAHAQNYAAIDTQGNLHGLNHATPIANVFALINAPEPEETEPMLHYNRR